MVNTTLKVSEETKKELDKLKVHPRQSYDEVIANLLHGMLPLEEKKK